MKKSFSSAKYLLRPDDIPIDVFITELSFYNLGRDTVEHFLKNEGMLRTPTPPKSETIERHPEYSQRTFGGKCRQTISLVWELCEAMVSMFFMNFSFTSYLVVYRILFWQYSPF